MMSSCTHTLLALACAAALVAAVPSKPAVKSEASAANTTEASSAANSTEEGVQYPFRDLPADVLRDFPGFCFGSTALRLFKVHQSWSLTPFCGVATCLVTEDGFHLIERVQDCGPQPKRNPKCHNTNAGSEASFPGCCPVYECEEGASLEYPTEEELASLAMEAAQEAVRAQYEEDDEEAGSSRSSRKNSAETDDKTEAPDTTTSSETSTASSSTASSTTASSA